MIDKQFLNEPETITAKTKTKYHCVDVEATERWWMVRVEACCGGGDTSASRCQMLVLSNVQHELRSSEESDIFLDSEKKYLETNNNPQFVSRL